MANQDDIDRLKAKRICFHCVEEEYLSAEIRQQGTRGVCSYCDRRVKSYTIGDLAERIATVFEQHYRRTSDQPNAWQQSLLSDRESTYDWERDGDPVIYAIGNAAQIPEQAAADIQGILEDQYYDHEAAKMGDESEFSGDSYYEESATDDRTWQEEWRSFERSLKTEARFFSRAAAAHLASIFGGIDKMSTHDGRPLVLSAGPGTRLETIYRARVFQTDNNLETALCRPDQHLGSPPANLASAGRMNARGISVFYGANEPSVAIAEVRPPVGSQVAVARFDIVRPLKLLDLTALSAVTEPGSIFDAQWAARLERASFLRSLSRRITRAVMPDDEAFDYLPTQAIADFLATENEPQLDGIVFPSVQAPGDALNVVLFHKAARVAALEFPEGTEIEASTGQTGEDGWEVDYFVIERTPPKDPSTEAETSKKGHWDFGALAFHHPSLEDHDSRDSTLQIDLSSIKVNVVRGVQFECDEHEVRRHRSEKHDFNF